MNISASQNKAAGEFVDLIASKASSGGRAVHPETAISCAARIAGSLLLRSFNLGLGAAEPGTVVLSNEANEKGPQLVSILAAFLANNGVSLDQSLLGGKSANRGSEPQLSTIQTLSLLQADALNIASQNNLTLEQAAQSAALATAFIVKESARNIAAETGFNVASFGFVEGSKTVPPPAAIEKSTSTRRKPWYRLS